MRPRTSLGRRLQADRRFRIVFCAGCTLVMNLLYGVGHAVFGVLDASAWLLTMGAYHILLGVMRFGAVLTERRHGSERFVMRFCGGMLMVLALVLGASTVLMAAGSPLPPQVKGVLADCGFTSPKAIILKVIRQLKLPSKLLYPFVRLGARLFGGFDLEAGSALETVKHATVPVIFFHGEDDDFVPMQMSEENFQACTGRKKLVITPGAGHGLCYPVDPDGYLHALREFFGPELSTKD